MLGLCWGGRVDKWHGCTITAAPSWLNATHPVATRGSQLLVRAAHTLLTVIDLLSGLEGVAVIEGGFELVVTEGGFLALALAFRCCLIIWWTSFSPK